MVASVSFRGLLAFQVGTKLDAPIQCHHCRQRFMDQRALELHLRFVYDPKSATAKLAE